MRIVDIRERAIPLKSDLKNSSFDFSEMTTSVVAVITDVVRGGRPVAGFAFNSTGRYACGAQMRERLEAIGFTPVLNTPAEFGARIKDEMEKWGKVVRDANLKIQ